MVLHSTDRWRYKLFDINSSLRLIRYFLLYFIIVFNIDNKNCNNKQYLLSKDPIMQAYCLVLTNSLYILSTFVAGLWHSIIHV